MSERTAVNLIYAGIFVVSLPALTGLHALGASNQVLACAAIAIGGVAAVMLSKVTVRYADARRRRRKR